MNARNLLIFVSTLAIVSYYAAIFYVWHHALEPDKIVYPGGFITLIGGTLATHFGAVFGMNRLNENSATPMKPLTWLESIAAWAYLVSLVIAVLIWGYEGFDAKFVEAIRNLALTFPGILGGVLAVAVNARVDPK